MTQTRLERMGYGFLLQEIYDWAIRIFQLDAALYPGFGNAKKMLKEIE